MCKWFYSRIDFVVFKATINKWLYNCYQFEREQDIPLDITRMKPGNKVSMEFEYEENESTRDSRRSSGGVLQ